jgi:hypothetical protein
MKYEIEKGIKFTVNKDGKVKNINGFKPVSLVSYVNGRSIVKKYWAQVDGLLVIIEVTRYTFDQENPFISNSVLSAEESLNDILAEYELLTCAQELGILSKKQSKRFDEMYNKFMNGDFVESYLNKKEV